MSNLTQRSRTKCNLASHRATGVPPVVLPLWGQRRSRSASTATEFSAWLARRHHAGKSEKNGASVGGGGGPAGCPQSALLAGASAIGGMGDGRAGRSKPIEAFLVAIEGEKWGRW